MVRLPRRRAVFGVLLGLLLPAACLSPTLPLPPPERPDTIEGPDASGQVRLTGTVVPGATAYARNTNLGGGVFDETDGQGLYELVLRADVGHSIVLWYQLGGERSQAITFEVPEPPP